MLRQEWDAWRGPIRESVLLLRLVVTGSAGIRLRLDLAPGKSVPDRRDDRERRGEHHVASAPCSVNTLNTRDESQRVRDGAVT